MTGSTICALDPGVLGRLGHDLDDARFAHDLAVRYRSMLTGRVRRVEQALRGDDHAETIEAVLSLKASSGTIGACELVAVATELEQAVRRLDLGSAIASGLQLGPAAARADQALAAYLAESETQPASIR
ncbi:Hpt domain-containing protein [Nocardioides ferulae]|uniref:Hpt domain-containing protein n=1 Tax=Nocardioides ferulae TaxID=2340821 RepID=UPI000EB5054F|nr:Hpt domain-containing protein [Nocardioides ferulae]